MIKKFLPIQGLIVASLVVLTTSCDRPSPQPEQTVTPTPSPSATETPNSSQPQSIPNATNSEPKAANQALEAGEYCFNLVDKNQEVATQFIVTEDRQVNGSTNGVIHNQDAGYYTSYTEIFKGTANENQLNLNLTTKIELDTQNKQEIWQVTNGNLDTGRLILQPINCSQLPEVGAKSETPTPERRIEFAPGTTSTLLEDSVVRGERHRYLVNAAANQTMTLSVSALENNAAFDVIAPNGETLKQEVTEATITLPTTGDYAVVIGGTRGNATYKLQVEIK